ncbi:hypothetical protein GGTG_11008 [Gaeumannomyces tritici R3-111a-1]|uniref:Major facilitator superfamily (MFS) profile domain-containing protein n=1 Tax=Gaeumannomyces tritici (strain R3-111a-1) TaxID=644352 RepID=J3PBY4_GAET3|nr:hypothetical protein GGTG_11008 [Gaeumannomyces tritici R3-111a-1]EJT71754.1 hypothetical protein GGTG_11008 [Gaeumannomyces tritici R3-111a-1]
MATETLTMAPAVVLGSKTTAYELESHAGATDTDGAGSVLTQHGRRLAVGQQQQNASDDSDRDPVLEASRLADSEVPDGGYGWVVIGCSAVASMWYTGTPYSWGIIQADLVRRGLSTPATLSFVGSLAPTLMAVLGVATARLLGVLGVRRTALLGIFTLGLSALLSGFAVDSVPGLFFTAGVVQGVAMSLCFLSCGVVPAQYFSRKRGLANGIVYSGGGIGGAVISLGLDSLLQRVGPAWTFRILGLAVLSTGLPAAWFIKERVPITHRVKFIDWRLFKDFNFFLIFLASGIAVFPVLVPPFFTPMYAQAMGHSSSVGAGLVAGFNFSSAVGRIGTGLLCDRLGALNALIISTAVNAASMLALWPASTSLPPLAVFVVVNGLSNGGFFAAMPTVMGNTFGSARVAIAMGMVVTGWGGGYLMGAPIAGYLLAAYGGADNGLQAYRPAMFYAGSLALASTALAALMRFRINKSPWAKL